MSGVWRYSRVLRVALTRPVSGAVNLGEGLHADLAESLHVSTMFPVALTEQLNTTIGQGKIALSKIVLNRCRDLIVPS